jgi:Protein of unknown function (DUF2852)
MVLAEKLDEVGKIGWIAATVAGFWLFWPVGVAILVFLAWSGRMRAWRYANRGQWGQWYNTAPPGQTGRNGKWGGGCGWGSRTRYTPSGNRAFDEYREETLRRLEEEQREFVDYLERLRQAKDKAEFDQFMAERRHRPASPGPAAPENPEHV